MGSTIALLGSLSVKSSWNNNLATGSDGGIEKQAQIEFNASNSSSLYKNNLDEVRVNGLFGLFLIRFN